MKNNRIFLIALLATLVFPFYSHGKTYVVDSFYQTKEEAMEKPVNMNVYVSEEIPAVLFSVETEAKTDYKGAMVDYRLGVANCSISSTTQYEYLKPRKPLSSDGPGGPSMGIGTLVPDGFVTMVSVSWDDPSWSVATPDHGCGVLFQRSNPIDGSVEYARVWLLFIKYRLMH